MLKTLEEHNQEVRENRKSIPNGIKCPICEDNGSISELHDDLLSPILLTNPPQIKIFCKQCNFTGHRLG